MLHITNGDSVALESAVPGQVLPWRDILHEGPAPAGLSLDQMSEVRARYLAEAGYAQESQALADFRQRDAALFRVCEHEEVILWFEHDLFDQLQLIQLLDQFARMDFGRTRLSMICVDRFPGVGRFHGLGELQPDQLTSLFPTRREVSAEQLALGHRAWEAFCAPDPIMLQRLVGGDSSTLPFLKAALIRFLEEYPAVGDGLSRTERHILQTVAEGITDPTKAFVDQMATREEAPFLGDSSYFRQFQMLGAGPVPLVENAAGGWLTGLRGARRLAFMKQQIVLTDAGRDVLAGRADAVVLNGVDRWLGGVHFIDREIAWRWDRRQGRIVPSWA